MWLVCRNKDDGSLFICSRAAREAVNKQFQRLGEVINSNVLNKFPTYEEADHYKKEQQRIDDDLDNILN